MLETLYDIVSVLCTCSPEQTIYGRTHPTPDLLSTPPRPHTLLVILSRLYLPRRCAAQCEQRPEIVLRVPQDVQRGLEERPARAREGCEGGCALGA